MNTPFFKLIFVIFLTNFVAAAKPSLGRTNSVGRIVASAGSRHLLAKNMPSAPTWTEAISILEQFNLGTFDVSSIELQLHEDKPIRVFDLIARDEESWYGEEREGQGFMHLVHRSGSGHLSGMMQDQYKSYGIWTRVDGTMFATEEEQFQKDDRTSITADGTLDAEDEEQFQEDDSPYHEHHVPGGHRKLQASQEMNTLKYSRSLHALGGKSKKTRVDIMILYSQQAMCGHANLSPVCPATRENREAIEAEAKLNVAITNLAFAHSGINVELKLVHLALDTFDYNEDNQMTDDCSLREILEDDADTSVNCNPPLSNTPSLINDRTDVHELRDRHGADIVAYFIDKYYNDYTGGNGISGGSPNETPVGDHEAYIVMNRNSRFHFVFTHELGHIFGVTHENGFCNIQTTASTDGTFDGPCFKTIMVSRGEEGCECFNTNPVTTGLYGERDFTDTTTGVQDRVSRTMISPRIPLFSSPNIQYSGHTLTPMLCHSGPGSSLCPSPWSCYPCGTGRSAVEIIGNNAAAVAAFRERPSRPIPLVFGMIVLTGVAGSFYLKSKRNIVASDTNKALIAGESTVDTLGDTKQRVELHPYRSPCHETAEKIQVAVS